MTNTNKDIAVFGTQSVHRTFIYETINNKVPCGGFNFVGGGIIGKDVLVSSYDLDFLISVDDSMNIGTESIPVYPAKKIGWFGKEILKYMFEFGTDSNYRYKVVNKYGASLNMISYQNAVAGFFGVQCVGVSGFFKFEDLPMEEQEKMLASMRIMKIINQQDMIPRVLTSSGTSNITIKHVIYQLDDEDKPTINGVTLVLTPNSAYIALGAE